MHGCVLHGASVGMARAATWGCPYEVRGANGRGWWRGKGGLQDLCEVVEVGRGRA